ncbi:MULTISPECIES: DUF397 domain-containing protein [Streptomyces]|uniref:DUF397 domain-containing protein n=1 Tax=Streptomyces siderophoricus TaxID=2802281 RepID=A0ABS1MVR2_9ACTN|nr:DUF397 domain-containing protein [Streptomyces sp. 9-7]MBL1091872.1 DUF397 domain-containing protein [Streptomyces sp. 9-7]
MNTIPDASALSGWRKSSHSNGEGAECIEVADGYPGLVPVRDSKAPQGPALVFTADGWSAFVAAVKRGGFRA